MVLSVLRAVVLFVSYTLSASDALQVTFPTSSSPWVSCKMNVLQWQSNATDPEYFTVQLLNDNKVLYIIS